KEFLTLQQAVAEGRRARTIPSYEQLLSSINKRISDLKNNPFSGNLIPRRIITRVAERQYGTDKVFRLELAGYYRMLYTVVGDREQITVLILACVDHPTYDKIFGYRKK